MLEREIRRKGEEREREREKERVESGYQIV
jgi:hypothetical protein